MPANIFVPVSPVALFVVSIDVDVDVFVDIVGRDLCIVVVYILVYLTSCYLVSAILPLFWAEGGV